VTGANPDAIVYDPASKRVFTMNGRGANATAIDAIAGTVVGTVALNGRPEFAVSDGRGSIFVNIEDSNAVVRFNARTLQVEARWSPASARSGRRWCRGRSGWWWWSAREAFFRAARFLTSGGPAHAWPPVAVWRAASTARRRASCG